MSGSKGAAGQKKAGKGQVFGSDATRVLDKGVWKRFKHCQHCQQVSTLAEDGCSQGCNVPQGAEGCKLLRAAVRLNAADNDWAVLPSLLSPARLMPPPTPLLFLLIPTQQIVVERAKWKDCWDEIRFCSDRCKTDGKRAKRQQQQGEGEGLGAPAAGQPE